MADREDSVFTAGGGNTLGIIRHGREKMDRYERAATEQIFPGDVLERTVNADGDPAFSLHSGTPTKDAYVAVEARGRGMNADTDEGYAAGEEVIAVRPAGGGVHLSLASGESVTDGDPLVVNGAGDGTVIAESSEGAAAVIGHAGEGLDLGGASNPDFLKVEAE